tara:strand:+ start:239 stop:427 length:189 start_codon:yes stop_codon:yes gene_type:complete
MVQSFRINFVRSYRKQKNAVLKKSILSTVLSVLMSDSGVELKGVELIIFLQLLLKNLLLSEL